MACTDVSCDRPLAYGTQGRMKALMAPTRSKRRDVARDGAKVGRHDGIEGPKRAAADADYSSGALTDRVDLGIRRHSGVNAF